MTTRYTKEILEKLQIEISMVTDDNTMLPKLIFKTRDKTYSKTLTREHIEDLKWQTSLSEYDIFDILIDEFLKEHPKYLRRVKLENINNIKFIE